MSILFTICICLFFTAPLSLKVTFPQQYPETPPVLEIPNRSQVLAECYTSELLEHLKAVVSVYSMCPIIKIVIVKFSDRLIFFKVTGTKRFNVLCLYVEYSMPLRFSLRFERQLRFYF